MEVAYGDQHKTLPLLVVAGEGPSLIGWDWLLQIQLDWQQLGLHTLRTAPPSSLQDVLRKHDAMFCDELGLGFYRTTEILQGKKCSTCLATRGRP